MQPSTSTQGNGTSDLRHAIPYLTQTNEYQEHIHVACTPKTRRKNDGFAYEYEECNKMRKKLRLFPERTRLLFTGTSSSLLRTYCAGLLKACASAPSLTLYSSVFENQQWLFYGMVSSITCSLFYLFSWKSGEISYIRFIHYCGPILQWGSRLTRILRLVSAWIPAQSCVRHEY